MTIIIIIISHYIASAAAQLGCLRNRLNSLHKRKWNRWTVLCLECIAAESAHLLHCPGPLARIFRDYSGRFSRTRQDALSVAKQQLQSLEGVGTEESDPQDNKGFVMQNRSDITFSIPSQAPPRPL